MLPWTSLVRRAASAPLISSFWGQVVRHHSSVKKRFKLTGNGDIKCGSQGMGHRTGLKRHGRSTRKRAESRFQGTTKQIKNLMKMMNRRRIR